MPRESLAGGYAPVRTASTPRDDANDSGTESDGEAAEASPSLYAPPAEAEGQEDFGQYVMARLQASNRSVVCVGVLVLILVLALGGGGGTGATPGPPVTVSEADGPIFAACELRPTTQSELGSGLFDGTMYLTYTPGRGTDVEITAQGMSPGKHGVHIHALGDLSDLQLGASTGGHYNPHSADHGCAPNPNRKAGDLGNMLVNGRGEGYYAEQANPQIKLQGATSIIGRSLIVHALEDNCAPVEGARGDLSAGARIGFCTIGSSEQSADRLNQRGTIRRRYERR